MAEINTIYNNYKHTPNWNIIIFQHDTVKSKRLNLRLSPKDYNLISNAMRKSKYNNISEFVRETILDLIKSGNYESL